MADYLIEQDELGQYEFPVPADTVVTVDIEADPVLRTEVQLIVHAGAAPVYAKRGTTVTPREKTSMILIPMMITPIPLEPAEVATVAVVSNADAVVSVARS